MFAFYILFNCTHTETYFNKYLCGTEIISLFKIYSYIKNYCIAVISLVDNNYVYICNYGIMMSIMFLN